MTDDFMAACELLKQPPERVRGFVIAERLCVHDCYRPATPEERDTLGLHGFLLGFGAPVPVYEPTTSG